MYEVYLDGKLLYYPGDKVNTVISAILKTKLNDSGTFDVTIPRKNPLYGKFKERASELLIKKNGKEIWNGEIRGNKGNLKKENVIHAVGELSYLGASSQPQKKYTNVNPLQMMVALVNIHNSQVEPRKQFTVGVVTVGNYNYDWITNYENTLDFIRKEMCDKLGGYLRIRKVDGVRYIDLVSLKDYGKSCEQTIKFGKNLLDYATGISADAIATAVRPLGTTLENGSIEGVDSYLTIESVNDGKDYLENTDAIQSGIGYIWKTVHFNVLTTPEAVKTAGENWLKDNQFQNMTIDVTAIDLSEINSNIESFELGDSVRITAKPFGLDRWSYVTEKKLDLLDPVTKHNISIGDNVKKTYTQQMADEKNSLKKEIPQQSAVLQLAKQNASELLQNAAEGNIFTIYDDAGKPKELLIMDTQDIKSAKKVWRWNINGLGYSSTGYNGEYGLAMTMNGEIVADFITAGVLNAALIKAGILSDKAGKNYFNLETGEFRLSASATVGDSTVASTKNVEDAKQEAEKHADNAASKAAGQAETNAKADTDEKLKLYATTELMQSTISQTAEGIKSDVSKTYATQTSMRESIGNLQQQIDGAIETFSGSDVPTLSNYPVIDWKDDATKDTHVGDLYIVNADGGDNAGFYYRFEKTASGYQWTLLKDNEITKALQDAKEANEKAQAVEDNLKENYSTTTQMNSAIDQTAKAINLEVSKKVGADEIIAKINLSAEKLLIAASLIDIDGVLDVEKLNALDIIAKTLAAEKGTIAGWEIAPHMLSKTIDLYPDMTETGLANVGDNDPVQYIVWIQKPSAATTAAFYIGYRFKSYYLSGGQNWYTLFAARPNGEVTANKFKSNHVEITGGDIDIVADSAQHYLGTKRGSDYSRIYPALVWTKSDTGAVMLDASGSLMVNADYGTGGNVLNVNSYNAVFGSEEVVVKKDFYVSGTKSRKTKTENYGERLLYCYETPSPLFGDIGEGVIDETGKCYVFLDDIFSETVDISCTYQVFLQPYGEGKCYVEERTSAYFVVAGTENLMFGWEVKCVQKDYDTIRLEEFTKSDKDNLNVTIAETSSYLNSLLYDVESEEFLNEEY